MVYFTTLRYLALPTVLAEARNVWTMDADAILMRPLPRGENGVALDFMNLLDWAREFDLDATRQPSAPTPRYLWEGLQVAACASGFFGSAGSAWASALAGELRGEMRAGRLHWFMDQRALWMNHLAHRCRGVDDLRKLGFRWCRARDAQEAAHVVIPWTKGRDRRATSPHWAALAEPYMKRWLMEVTRD